MGVSEGWFGHRWEDGCHVQTHVLDNDVLRDAALHALVHIVGITSCTDIHNLCATDGQPTRIRPDGDGAGGTGGGDARGSRFDDAVDPEGNVRVGSRQGDALPLVEL